MDRITQLLFALDLGLKLAFFFFLPRQCSCYFHYNVLLLRKEQSTQRAYTEGVYKTFWRGNKTLKEYNWIPGYGLHWWLSSIESICDSGVAGATGSIPTSGRSPGRGHGNSLQYFCLENAMDREAWQATVHRVAES